MKIVRYISMIISLGRKFIPIQGLVVVFDCDSPEYDYLSIKKSHLNPPDVLRSLIHDICFLYKYASDFIWMLGKNNLDSLRRLPVASDTDRRFELRFRIAAKTEAILLWR
jgi:hypothetical protein